ncbi:PspC domain-containing protein [Sphaerisporangium sp. NPDC005289]|uniref:PspC domain-containing protein n=1 Tax=Sphaerisporangium sp. NPDC005289 TaxID=3155247 RepID=UPI0033B0F3B7
MNEERVLQRSDEGRMLTGVCAGLGRYTGMDPVIFRVGFAALVIGSGIGIMLYVAAFLLMRSTNGGPGYVEQWSRRVFDTETVMALLAAIFALGLIINLAAGGISTATVVVGTLLAITLLAAHARGVDLLAMARSLPERVRGKKGTRPAPDSWLGHPFGGPPPFPPTPFAGGPGAAAPPAGDPYAQRTAATGDPYDPYGASARDPYGPPTDDRYASYAPPAPGAPPAPPAPGAARAASAMPADTSLSGASPGETLPTDGRSDASPAETLPADGSSGTRLGETLPADGSGPRLSETLPAGGSADVTRVQASPADAPPPASAAFTPPASGAPADSGPAPAPDAHGPYRRLADLAEEARAASGSPAGHESARYGSSTGRSARYGSPAGSAGSRYGDRRPTGGGFDSSGEPFAPRGPYRPYDSQRQYEPPAWVYGNTPPARTARRDRPKSFIGAVTVFIAFMVGGIMVATQSSSSSLNAPVIGGAVLITIGAGLLVATWFGRGAGLVATGTIVAFLLVAGSTVNGIPKKIGSYTWEPVDSSQAVRTYSVGIGDGTLDLRDTKFPPGSSTRFDASVSVGELKVIVPRTARVKVFGYTRLGDVKIEHVVQGGADVHHDKVIEPDVTSAGTVPVIELHVKAGIGDVEVSRAA